MWNYVEGLPDGVHTVVGERGGRLSGGQRQRIALARAHRPKLLLPEPTSALDQHSEQLICDTLTQLKPAITIIAVSHQLRLNAVADRVYRLQKGVLNIAA